RGRVIQPAGSLALTIWVMRWTSACRTFPPGWTSRTMGRAFGLVKTRYGVTMRWSVHPCRSSQLRTSAKGTMDHLRCRVRAWNHSVRYAYSIRTEVHWRVNEGEDVKMSSSR